MSDDDDIDDEEVADDEDADDGEADESSANIGEASVEINVESLIAEIEADCTGALDPHGKVRKRLEEILEERRIAKEIMDFDDYDIDDEP